MKKLFLTLAIISFFHLYLNAQAKQGKARIDSLSAYLKTAKEDTSKVNTLIAFVNEYLKNEQTDSIIYYGNKVLELSKKINYELGIARGYRGIGLGYKIKKDHKTAVEYFSNALVQDEKIGNKVRMKDEYRNLTVSFSALNNFAKSLEYASLLLKLCEDTKDTVGIAMCYENNIAGNYALQNDNFKTIENVDKALKLFELLGDKKNIIDATIKLGNIYGRKMSNFPKALEYYLKALRLAEDVGDKGTKINSCFYIADMYKATSDYPKALEYKIKALKMLESEKDKTVSVRNGIAACYIYIGTIYLEQDDNIRALDYINKALAIFSDIKSKEGLGSSYLMLGQVYTKQSDYEKGKENFLKGNAIFAELVKENPLYYLPFSGSYGGLGKVYYHEKDYHTAIKYHALAIKLNKEHNCSAINLIDHYKDISMAYEAIKDYKSALDNFKLSKQLHDSIFSEVNNKKMGDLQSKFDIEKKEIELNAKAQAEQEKIKAVANAESKKQKLIILFVALGLLFVLVFAGFVVRSLRLKSKQNKIIVEQKEIVEEKNREILDSIEYALRIQTAILPPQKIVKQYLENSFILYKPKDIVAGDFYWMETVQFENENQFENMKMNDNTPNFQIDKFSNSQIILFAACDCTGHGVPGAMVSVVCHNALNRAVREFGLTQPAAILDKTAEIVIENFSKSEESIKDGMDISLCAYNFTTRELQWAGANNPLWIVKKIDNEKLIIDNSIAGNSPLSIDNYQLIETKADKQPIGMNEDSKPFTNHSFYLNSGDTIYLFTDGFADQFGGESGEKKVTKKRFKEIILSIQNKSLQEQGISLDLFIAEFRKEIEQIDDILVMGVKV